MQITDTKRQWWNILPVVNPCLVGQHHYPDTVTGDEGKQHALKKGRLNRILVFPSEPSPAGNAAENVVLVEQGKGQNNTRHSGSTTRFNKAFCCFSTKKCWVFNSSCHRSPVLSPIQETLGLPHSMLVFLDSLSINQQTHFLFGLPCN